jgi:DNA-binding IclR family transcriptional regulator
VPDSETKVSPYRVQVLDRALAILDTLSKEREDLSLMELTARLQLHKSTAHRLLMILERHRMVEREPQTGRYRLGLRLFELGALAIARFDIRDRARPHLERVLFETEETVHLCVLDAGEVLYVDKLEPSRSVRMASRIGRLSPAHCSAVGKAMLAHLAEREVDDILKRHGLPRMTARTMVTPADLKAELQSIRQRGYAIDNEEAEDGVRCVGAAVLGHHGRPLGAISASAPSFRLTMERVPAVAASVCRAAQAISVESGYRGPVCPEAREWPDVVGTAR